MFTVTSADRSVTVRAPGGLVSRWPAISPHIPAARPLTNAAAGKVPDAVVPSEMATADVRRLLNAHIHVAHVRHGTLPVHAVGLEHPAHGSILLLGGHGAGKTLVMLALVADGWRLVAGDVALVDCSDAVPRLLGGTSAVIGRRRQVRRWFPSLEVPDGPGRVDLRPYVLSTPDGEAGPVTVAAVVDVDGDPQAISDDGDLLDSHTAATVWWRASGHLVDRLVAFDSVMLRYLEDAACVAGRLARVRLLADSLPLRVLSGSPQSIATRIECLAQREAAHA